MGAGGKRIIADLVSEVENSVVEYYGQLNELRAGASAKVPGKPAILMLSDRLKSSGLPIFAGGYMDQPFLTMELLHVARNTESAMINIQQAAMTKNGSS